MVDRPRRARGGRVRKCDGRPSACRAFVRMTMEALEPRALLSSGNGGDGGGGFDESVFVDPLAYALASGMTAAEAAAAQAEAARATAIAYAPPGQTTGVNGSAITTWTTNAAGLPLLASRPGAPTALYLDFDGSGSFTPYSEDGDPETFNVAEQRNIVEAWRHLAVYFAMFDLNVTTVLPIVPMAYNVISNSVSNGYAYVGTFPTTSAQGFNESGHARSRQSAIAHEAGHIFGLSHQSDYDSLGNRTAEYSSGYDKLHGPIMGVDYAQAVHKWIIGHPSSSPSTLQDDAAVIAGKIRPYTGGGDGYRPDDFGGTIAAATPLEATGSVQWRWGVIERLADVDAFSFTVDGSSPVVVSASRDWPSAVDLKLAVHDASGRLLALADGALNDQQVVLDLPAGTYYALVSGAGNAGDLGAYDVAVRPMHDLGWRTQDVGYVQLPGYAQYDAATQTFALGGSGSNISGSSDAFRFLFATLVGNGSITARVESVEHVSGSTKAGVMIRDSLADNAKHAAILLEPTDGTTFRYRSSTGGSSSSVTASGPAAPYWLRLVRTGNTITASRSTNGKDWTQQGSPVTITMGAAVHIGLVVTSASETRMADATFSHVTLTGAVGPILPTPNALPAPADLAVALAAAGTGLTLTWSDVEGETGYVVERSDDGVSWAQVGATGAGVTTFSDPNLPGSRRYFYRVSAVDATGRSPTSEVASAVNRPSPPTHVEVVSWQTDKLIVNWRDTTGETGYRIERSADGGNTWSAVGTVGANVPSFTSTGLTAGTPYRFRVIPLNATLGEGPASAVAAGSTRLAAVGGLAFTNKAPNQMVLRWDAVPSATSYRIDRSTDGGKTFTTIGTTALLTYVDNSVSPMTEYHYRVVGTNALTEGLYSTIFAATPPAPSAELPAPWSSQDVGSVGGTGAAGHSAGTFTVLAAGDDIWGTTDEFRFVWMPLIGDGQIVARVTSVEDTDSWAKAGVMIRESLAANSKYALMAVTPGNGVTFQRRNSTGGQATSSQTGGLTAPYWVRLVRSGNTITGSYSADGTTWTQLSSTTISNLSSTVYIGLALTSHDDDELARATFTNVTVSNSAPTVQTAPAASPSIVSGATSTLSVLGADDHGAANLTYAWSVLSKPAGAPDPTFSVNGTNAASTSVATFAKAGTYALRVTITDAMGLSTTANVNVTVNQTLTSVTVTPATAQVMALGKVTFSAVARDQFGDALASQPASFTWTVASGGGSVSESGLYAAPAIAGQASVAARAGTVTGTAEVEIVPLVLGGSAGADTFTLRRDADSGELRVTVSLGGADPTVYAFPAAVLQQLALDGGEGDDLFILDLAGGSAADDPGALIELRGGAGADAVSILGAADAADTVSISATGVAATSAADASATLELADVERALIDLRGGYDAVEFTGGTWSAALAGEGLALRLAGPAQVTLEASSSSVLRAIEASGTSLLRPPAAGPALVTDDLLLVEDGSIDLVGAGLIVRTTEETAGALLQRLRAYAASGRAGGTWDGPGLRAPGAPPRTGVAVVRNRDLDDVTPLRQTFGGVAVDADDVLVTLAVDGDANLDGRVDAADYFRIDRGAALGRSGYDQGDFDHAGPDAPDADDYLLIDRSFMAGLTDPPAAAAAPAAAAPPALPGAEADGWQAALPRRDGDDSDPAGLGGDPAPVFA